VVVDVLEGNLSRSQRAFSPLSHFSGESRFAHPTRLIPLLFPCPSPTWYLPESSYWLLLKANLQPESSSLPHWHEHLITRKAVASYPVPVEGLRGFDDGSNGTRNRGKCELVSKVSTNKSLIVL